MWACSCAGPRDRACVDVPAFSHASAHSYRCVAVFTGAHLHAQARPLQADSFQALDRSFSSVNGWHLRVLLKALRGLFRRHVRGNVMPSRTRFTNSLQFFGLFELVCSIQFFSEKMAALFCVVVLACCTIVLANAFAFAVDGYRRAQVHPVLILSRRATTRTINNERVDR